MTAKSCRIEATFEVSKQDVHLTDAEGLWRHDISPNQHAVLERKLVLFLLETKLKPYLSWAQLCYECTPMEKQPEAIALIAESDLKKTIDLIIAAETKDILELATIAGLNPKIDFAGGNWRGTSLSANLIETNLSNTNFSGAKVNEARFGKNIGISEEAKLNLKQRKAIFEEGLWEEGVGDRG